MLQLTPEILAIAISLDEGVAKLTTGEQQIAINRMEAIVRARLGPHYDHQFQNNPAR